MSDILSSLGSGFLIALQPFNLLMAFLGAGMGLLVGAMPGIGSLAGVALLLPLTFQLDPNAGIIMLAALYYANMYGGSFSAILLNIPGDSPAVMTAIDGHKLTQKGKAGKALLTAITASFIGGTIGIIILTFLGLGLARIGLHFGPAEMTMIILMALTSIGWILGDNPVKGLVTTGLGLMLATVGVDLSTGAPRYAFGIPEIMSGVSFIPLVIGAFGFSQVLLLYREINSSEPEQKPAPRTKISLRESLLDKGELKEVMPAAVKSGLCGTFIGVLPGAGATMASFLSYLIEKKSNRLRGKEMGNGVLVGVAAPEAGNNAAAVGAFAPLLSLGIPGSGTTAVLMGGLMMWGLRPGPLLFTESPDFTWGLLASMYVGNLICVLVALLIIPFLIRILYVPKKVIIPVISVVCVAGAYSVGNNLFDVGLMLVSGIVGYLLTINAYPIAPLLLAFVLGPILEKSMNAAFEISGGEARIFIQSPIAASFLAITVLICLVPLLKKLFALKNKPTKEFTNER